MFKATDGICIYRTIVNQHYALSPSTIGNRQRRALPNIYKRRANPRNKCIVFVSPEWKLRKLI